MIECTNSNVYYKNKKRRFRKKRLLTFFIVLLTIFCFACYYKNIICVNLFSINTAHAYKCSTQSVNEVLIVSLSNNIKYSDLVIIEKDNNGDISLISANSYKLNIISQEIAKDSAVLLESKLKKGTPVSLMAFTGIDAFSGYGKTIFVKNLTVSNVICKFNSKFTSMGINQTLHEIYVDVICNVNINLPFNNKSVECVIPVLISETILVGKVPEMIINSKLFG